MRATDRLCLRRSESFALLDDEVFEALVAHVEVLSLGAGEELELPGASSARVYVVLEGSCEALAWSGARTCCDPGHCITHASATTVRAIHDARLALLTTDALHRELASRSPTDPHRVLRSVLARSASATTDALLEQRRQIGVFVAYLVAVVGVFMFVRDGLRAVTDLDRGTTVITLPVIAVMGIVLVALIRSLGLPASSYGLTRHRWRASLREGLWLALLLVAAVTLVKWSFVRFSSEHGALPILDPLDTRGVGPAVDGMLARWLWLNLAYVGVVVPIEELIARGLLQGMLERILVTRHDRWWSIVLSNLLFAAFHLYLSISMAVATLLLGVALGWLYARTRNLLGVCVAHALVGVWSLTVVRLQTILG